MLSARLSRLRLLPLAAGMAAVSGVVLAVCAALLITRGAQEGTRAVSEGRVVTIRLPDGVVETGSAASAAQAAGSDVPTEPAAPGNDTAEVALLPLPGEGLKAAPAEPLTEKTDLGPLPKIAADGTRPWQYYGRPFTRAGEAPVIAVAVTGVGLNRASTDLALKLPPDISIAVSPYAQESALWAASARSLGHEVLVDLPAEPEGYPANDPGPFALFASLQPQENEKRLRWILSRFSGAVGGITGAKERFLLAPEAAEPALRVLADRGLLLVSAGNPPPEAVFQLGEKITLPVLRTDGVLTAETSREDIANILSNIENMAKRRGSALLTVEASPVLLRELAAWTEGLAKRGIVLAPVSALARMKVS